MQRNSSSFVLSRIGAASALAALFAAPAFSQVPGFLDYKAPAVWCSKTGDDGGCANEEEEGYPYGVATADIMGTTANSGPDGYPDVVIVNGVGDTVSVFRNTGDWVPPQDGLELTATHTLTAGQPYDVELADMDGDQDLDMVISVRASSTSRVMVYYNNGVGVFSNPPTETLTMTHATGLTVADLDGNGQNDVAVAGQFKVTDTVDKPEIEVVWFESPLRHEHIKVKDVDPTIDIGEGSDVVAAVINQPQVGGRLDLVMSMHKPDSNINKIFVLLNEVPDENSPVVWNKSVQDAVDSRGIDFGKLRTGAAKDLVLGRISNDQMRAVWGDGEGEFELRPNVYDLFEGQNQALDPSQLKIGKLDAGNKNDVVIACQHGWPEGHGCIAVFLGNGDGTFATTPRLFPVEPTGQNRHPKPCFVQIDDMDNDGFNDVVTSNNDGSTLSVLIYNITTPLP